MAKIDVTKTELIWPGKYNGDGTLRAVPRESLPFQVIETVNENRAMRQSKQPGAQESLLFEAYEGKEGDTFEEGWKNKLVWGDNLLVMGSLLEKFAGKIDLIYIDPPFATGADFSFTTQVGECGEKIAKKQSVIEEKAYRDTWGMGIASFISMIYERLALMRDLLAEDGSIYVHCDYRVSGYIRLALDEIFGADGFRNEITWRRQITRGMKTHAKYMPFSADTIFLYTKSEAATWNIIEKENFISLEEANRKYKKDKKGYFRTSDRGSYSDESLVRLNKEGRIYVTNGGKLLINRGKVSTNRGNIAIKYYREQVGNRVKEVTTVDNIWDDIPGMGVVSHEYIGYPTQKPEALLERIIKASSNEGDLIADFFCGSGTTLAVAEKLGRRWVGCDLGRWAIHTTRKRLLEIENCKPFEILNLGKYERQYWQGVTFNGAKDKSLSEQALYEYLAFILRLYKAQPVSDVAHLHGRKGKAMVHVGAVDAPVTIDEVSEALDECEQLKQKELHVLGWEWEMGLAGPNNEVQKGSPMHGVARQKEIRLRFLQIPREVMEQQAVDKGDVRFFELAYLKCNSQKIEKDLTVQIKIEDFVIPNPELIPEDVRDQVKGWSDYIDYWAVDWDFQHDTFMQGWVVYRTRNERVLALESDPHTYERPGEYKALVKVIDIFGNDTSQLLDIKVK